jgi:ATP-dependent Clp protease protease subunit
VADHLLDSRIVVLGAELDDEVANRVAAQLLLLAAADAQADISLYVSSPDLGTPGHSSAGSGSPVDALTAAMVIHDTMRHVEPDVATWGLGAVVGLAQFLLSAGAPGKRYALPNTRVLMRQPTARVDGTASDITTRAEVLTAWKQQIAELTAAQTGQTVERILADSDHDHWFTAQEAQEYGLVDQVVNPP